MRRLLWAGLLEAETLAKDPDKPTQLKALATIGTLGGVYIRAVESHDLQHRLERVEQALSEISKEQPK